MNTVKPLNFGFADSALLVPSTNASGYAPLTRKNLKATAALIAAAPRSENSEIPEHVAIKLMGNNVFIKQDIDKNPLTYAKAHFNEDNPAELRWIELHVVRQSLASPLDIISLNQDVAVLSGVSLETAINSKTHPDRFRNIYDSIIGSAAHFSGKKALLNDADLVFEAAFKIYLDLLPQMGVKRRKTDLPPKEQFGNLYDTVVKNLNAIAEGRIADVDMIEKDTLREGWPQHIPSFEVLLNTGELEGIRIRHSIIDDEPFSLSPFVKAVFMGLQHDLVAALPQG